MAILTDASRDPSPSIAYDLYPGRAGAPQLVYCHGLLSNRTGMRARTLRQWCEERGWTLLLFDFQGRGDSSGAMQEVTLTRQIEDLGAVLAVLPDGSRPLLFGASFGGLTAAWFAALFPDRVRVCVLVAPAFGFVPGLLVKVGLAAARRWRQDGRLAFGPPIDLTVSHGLVADAADYPDALLAASFQTPALVFHGTADASVSHEGSVAFADGARSGLVSLQLFTGGDHVLHDRMPAILEQLEPFLERLSPP